MWRIWHSARWNSLGQDQSMTPQSTIHIERKEAGQLFFLCLFDTSNDGWCIHKCVLSQGRVLSCPSRDRGDKEVWRASWKTLTRAKRRRVNLHTSPFSVVRFSEFWRMKSSCRLQDVRTIVRLTELPNSLPSWRFMPGSLKCWKRSKLRCASPRTMTHVWQRLWLLLGESLPSASFPFGVRPAELFTAFPDSWSTSFWTGPIQWPWSQCSTSSETPTGSIPRIWIKLWSVCEAPALVPLHTSHETKALCFPWDSPKRSPHSALAQPEYRSQVVSARTAVKFSCTRLSVQQCVSWLFPGHIHQLQENLSKTPQELIPAVFPNTWGTPNWNFNHSRT